MRSILALGMAVGIMAVGTVGILVPSGLVWIAEHFVTSGPFYVLATIRVAFGLVLISVASVSRAPKTLRFVGSLILIAGVASALTGLLALDRGRASIEWWLRQGTVVVRLTGVLVVAFGALIAYASAPARRTA